MDEDRGAVSRRRFIAAGAAAATGALWVPAAHAAPASRLPTFPAGVPLRQERFENWAHAIDVEAVWTCAPATPAQVVDVVNWAWRHGYRVRARGAMHNWSPLTLAAGTRRSPRVLLVDTTKRLTRMRVARSGPAAVTTQTGATMEALLAFLEDAGLGLIAHPAPGGVTVGGVLAIGGHGTAIPARGERREPGDTFGSVSNLVLSLTAVVWSERQRRYVLRTFTRDDPVCASLLVNLGRTFVTEVTLRAGRLRFLRCVSRVDIPARELFAAPGAGGRTFAGFVERSGRAEAIWFPFTERPWLKVWTVSSRRPPGSRAVHSPYNYPFSDTLDGPALEALRRRIVAHPREAVALGQLSYATTAEGLRRDNAYDLWGPAKDVLLYVRPSTLRVTANGYAVLTRRRDIQRVVSEFVALYERVVARYRSRGLYPMNMPVEIRVTGLDHHGDAGIPHATTPHLSALRPLHDHPERDVAVWIDVLTFPTTQGSQTYYRELERFFFSNYSSYALVRPEWSKGWGFDGHSGWADTTVIGKTIPAAYGSAWKKARAELAALDPHRVYGNALLDRLFA
ncbi:MAG TPA: cholesterol oxidase substrate-binding domain-containing protein [Solirubrobacteraceae bacterium]